MCKELGLWKKLERAKLVETSRLKRPGMVPRKEANNKELRRAFNFFLKLRFLRLSSFPVLLCLYCFYSYVSATSLESRKRENR